MRYRREVIRYTYEGQLETWRDYMGDVSGALDWRLKHGTMYTDSPIARLSPEVILEIFRWAVVLDCEKLAMGFGRLLAGRSLTKDASIPDPPKSAPFNISCVSRTWREIAFANSSLWSTVIVDERPSNNISREVAWLGRSGQLPLSIRLQRDTEINLVSSFKSLIPHIFSKGIRERLRDVRIRSYTYMDFPDMTFKDAPFLEELSIRLPFVSFENQAAVTVDISKSPRLRSLHLDGYFIAKFSPTNRFTPLTELDLQYDCRLGSESACPHAQDILDLLPSAPNLQALRVMLSDKTLPSNSRSDFHLPNLRIFGIAITDGSAEATQSFMDCITFPSLETFETRILRWFSVLRWTPCFENTLALFERSKAPITKFRLEADMSGIDDGLSDWLQLMPQLKSLTLGDGIIANELWTSFARVDPGGKLLCPHLEDINLHDCKFISDMSEIVLFDDYSDPFDMADKSDSIPLLISLVATRCRSPSWTLKEMSFTHTSAQSFLASPIIENCMAQGLKVHCHDSAAGVVRVFTLHAR